MQCCESSSEERSAGNSHATICGNRRWATASGDPVPEVKSLRPTHPMTPVLDPGRHRTKKGFFWAMASDDRDHGGPSPPVVLFRYAPGRSGAYAEQFLRGYHGRLLQCDGYDGYELLTRVKRDEGPWMLVHCWSHLRRRFVVKLVRNTKSPIAETAVRHIAALLPPSKPTCVASRRTRELPRVRSSRFQSSKHRSRGSKSNCR